MRCPRCGAEMNRHAEKPVKDTRAEESTHYNPAFDGVVESIHCCPACGKVEAVIEK
jgi:ribosomal protein S27AE